MPRRWEPSKAKASSLDNAFQSAYHFAITSTLFLPERFVKLKYVPCLPVIKPPGIIDFVSAKVTAARWKVRKAVELPVHALVGVAR